MKRGIALGIVVGLLAAAPAMGADMPLKAPRLPPPAFSWTGFYVGANAGYAWGRSDVTTVAECAAPPGVFCAIIGGVVADGANAAAVNAAGTGSISSSAF